MTTTIPDIGNLTQSLKERTKSLGAVRVYNNPFPSIFNVIAEIEYAKPITMTTSGLHINQNGICALNPPIAMCSAMPRQHGKYVRFNFIINEDTHSPTDIKQAIEQFVELVSVGFWVS